MAFIFKNKNKLSKLPKVNDICNNCFKHLNKDERIALNTKTNKVFCITCGSKHA